MRVEPELSADADGPVTTTVTRRIKPGHEAAYEAFLAGISGGARAFPGYLGVEVFRPASGQGGEYRIVYRFASLAHLHAWLGSPEHAAWLQRAEPHVAEPMRTQVLTGLEGWFTLPTQPGLPPPRYKTALLTWVTIFPADHPGRGRHRAAARAPAAGTPARRDDRGDGAADDLGGDAPDDQAAGTMAVSRPAMTIQVDDRLRRFPCLAATRWM